MSTSTLQTPITEEKAGKRIREEESPSVTDTPCEDFKIIYRKRNKLNPKVNLSKDSYQEDNITTKETLAYSQVGD